MTDRIEADYLIETAEDPHHAAEVMAGEQSSGTFRPVPGETADLKARAGARVIALTEVEGAQGPSLPGSSAAPGRPVRRAHVTLSWPVEVMGPDLAAIMATVAGNLFELRPFSGLRLLDIRLPDAFAGVYPGPRFGVAGTRRIAGVEGRPLVGTIVKPSVGFTPDETAASVDALVAAGIDFIKDDELQVDGPLCPFEDRVTAVMRVIERHADRTGRKAMFAFNLSGEVDRMRRRHDHVLAQGGTCVMASINSVGMAGMVALGRHTQLPLHAHRNGWGYLSRAPMLGWSYPAWSKLWRLAGADHMHVNGLANKFCEPDDSVIASARSLLTPLFADRPDVAMPVFSSGQTAVQVHETWARLGSADLIYAAGGGIMAHPGGPAAGVESIRAAWDGAMRGETQGETARGNAAFARALQAFG